MAVLQKLVEKWVALYVRLSRDDENEGDSNSIAHQDEICQGYFHHSRQVLFRMTSLFYNANQE